MTSRILLERQALATPAFRDVLAFCSNMQLATVFGYPSNEHAYVAGKTLDLAVRERIRQEPSPYKIKRFGRQLTIRPDWDAVKLGWMELLVQEKFTVHEPLKGLLLETDGIELVERNTWNDRFWGQCHGVGENHLGKILMRVRAQILAGTL